MVRVYSLRGILFRLVVYFRGGSKTLLPMVRPVMVLHGYLLGSLGVPAHGHAVDETSHESQKAKYQEHYAQNPAENKHRNNWFPRFCSIFFSKRSIADGSRS